MTVQVNDQSLQLPAGCRLSALLQQLSLQGAAVAVERNGELLPAHEHAATLLQQGDVLEIVSLTGGG
jgi:sulfur carrier protein